MRKMDLEKEIHLQGFPVSEGIAIGSLFFLGPEELEIPQFPIALGEVDSEIARYRQALFSSREDLEFLQNRLVDEGSDEVAGIIDTHIQMLEDPLITVHMEESIRQMRQNTEAVFRSVISEYEKRFEQTKNSFFRQRLVDILDLSRRILGHLYPTQKLSLLTLPPNSVVFVKELIPSDAASVQAYQASAFVTYLGGCYSHAALITRAKGIPYVASINVDVLQNAHGKNVIVDGKTGLVILNPLPQTLRKYRQSKERLKVHFQNLEKEAIYDTKTIDGYSIKVLANLSSLSELDRIIAQGVSGVGLFRSEFLFLREDFMTSEEFHYGIYKQLLEKMGDRPVAIRVLDIGGEKAPLVAEQEKGLVSAASRGIRFLLRNQHIFKTQLRAILRASIFGNPSILFPLISDVYELREAKRIIDEVKKELDAENIPYKNSLPIGCMVEVPSAIITLDLILEECQYISIGTNDLLQYTLGTDRSNQPFLDFHFPIHLSIIRMIKMAVLQAKKYGVPIAVCGEIASNPLFIPLLIGLGVEEFSCAYRYIPLIKKTIRYITILDAYHMAEQVLAIKDSSEIPQILLNYLNKKLPKEVFKELNL